MRLDEIMRQMGEDGVFFGNVSFEVLAPIEKHLKVRHLVFFSDLKFAKHALADNKVVLTTKEIAGGLDIKSYCICDNPALLYFRIHNFLADSPAYKRRENGITIGQNCQISPLATISQKNVSIGDNVVIEEFVVIRENTNIGSNTIIRSGVKIGGEGFEFKRDRDNVIPAAHLGGVVIGDNVEVQYNSCVDRAVFPWDNTEIGNSCKINNLVHIAHGAKIKDRVTVAANACICGSAEIDTDSWVGPSATMVKTYIGKNARANVGSVVTKPVPDNAAVTGNFAIEHSRFIQNLKSMN